MEVKTITATKSNEGAKWYGKVSTAVFYIIMIILFVFPTIPYQVAEGLIALCGVFMLLSLILYDRHFKKLQREAMDRVENGR